MNHRGEIRDLLASQDALALLASSAATLDQPDQTGPPRHRTQPNLTRGSPPPAVLKGDAMSAWTSEELTRVAAADELEIASRRRDGTLGDPRTIWVVRVGDDLYVRSMYGRVGGWFPATQVHHQGHIQAGGVERDVTFADADPDRNDAIDAAYRDKYGRYGERIVGSVVNPAARAATIKLVPR
jgi:hypothetical protein